MKAPLKNAILMIDAEVNVDGCDAYRFAPIGHVSGALKNVTIAGQIVARGVNPAATMTFSRFINTFDDSNAIVGCGSSLKYDVYTIEGTPAQLAKVCNSVQGELSTSSFSLVNEPSGVMVKKEVTLLGEKYSFNVSTSVQSNSDLLDRYYLIPLRLYLNRLSYMRGNCAEYDVQGTTATICSDEHYAYALRGTENSRIFVDKNCF